MDSMAVCSIHVIHYDVRSAHIALLHVVQLSRLPLRSLSAKDINSRPQPDKKRLYLMR